MNMALNYKLMDEYNKVKDRNDKGWVSPVPFDEYTLPEFPINAFPKWLQEYVKGVAESTQTPIDAPGMAAISVLSTALAKKFSVHLTGEWSESLNTYSILALPSGNRKSSVFKALLEPIVSYEKEERNRVSSEVAEQKIKLKAKNKRLEQLEKQYAKNGDSETMKEVVALSHEIYEEKTLTLPRFITEDVTPEKLADLMSKNNEKMALLSAEGAGIFSIMAGRYSSDGKANIEMFLKGFSGDNCSIDRIGRDANILNEPTLTIGLFLQPDVIHGVPQSFQERGLMPRFLYSFPKSLVGYRKINPQTINEEIKQTYHSNIKKLLLLNIDKTVRLTFSDTAIEAERQLRTDIESMFLEGGDLFEMREWGSKLAGQIIRIAGLIHIAECIDRLGLSVGSIHEIPTEISGITFSKANQFTGYLIEHAKAAYGCMGADKTMEDAKYLLNVIKRLNKNVIPYREVQNLTRKRFRKAQSLKAILLELEDKGFISLVKEGRKTLLEVNPYILDNTTNTHNILKSLQTPSEEGKQSEPINYNPFTQYT